MQLKMPNRLFSQVDFHMMQNSGKNVPEFLQLRKMGLSI
jgi:hypothetical protein